ncbi:MAG TPA: DUF2017 family protein [Actinomycetota bacterium]|jgi:hypothetical protein
MGEASWSLLRPRPRIVRTGPGRFAFHLPEGERSLLGNLLPNLRQLVEAGDPSTRRLFPTAYHDDPQKEREYQELTRGDLVASRLSAIELVEKTIHDDTIDVAGLERWMEAINGLRLVIGTRLDVTEDLSEIRDDDPDASAYAVYDYLGWLLEQAVHAMSEDLPDRPEP